MNPIVRKSPTVDAARAWTPLIWLVVALLALAQASGLLARIHPAFEFATHFVPHYFVLGLGLAVAALLARRYVAFAVALGLGLSNVAPLWPYVVADPPAIKNDGPILRLVVANLDNMGADAQALDDFLQSTDAEIIVMTELAGHMEPAFARAQARFPYRLRTPGNRHDPYGLLILARRPLETPIVHQPFGIDFPVVEFRFCAEAEARACVAVIALHAVLPGEDDYLRDRQLGFAFERARLAGMAGEPAIVVGDLNTTPWSPVFKRFEGLGLGDAALGRGWLPTWPVMLGPAGIPIDHVLVSARLEVRSFSPLPAMGSDHRPVAVELGVPAAKSAR